MIDHIKRACGIISFARTYVMSKDFNVKPTHFIDLKTYIRGTIQKNHTYDLKNKWLVGIKQVNFRRDVKTRVLNNTI